MFLDLLRFEEVADPIDLEPGRDPQLGHYRVEKEILILLYVGIHRLWHFRLFKVC
jgi:hypothetical protein